MDWVEFGKIMGSHGIRGDMKFMAYNSDSPFLTVGRTVYSLKGRKSVPHRITFVARGNKGFRLHLDGIDTPEAAKALYGSELFVSKDELKPLGKHEDYVSDLLGLTVVDADNEHVYGTLRHVLETGAHDCYVVKAKGGPEILFPATRDTVILVDVEKGQMRVRLPEGLEDIYAD